MIHFGANSADLLTALIRTSLPDSLFQERSELAVADNVALTYRAAVGLLGVAQLPAKRFDAMREQDRRLGCHDDRARSGAPHDQVRSASRPSGGLLK